MIMAEPALAKREIVVPKVPALTMASKFGRYGPMDEIPTRKAEVSGDELSYLRKRREMLRSMTPKQALQVIEFHDGLYMFQALDLARKEKKLIVPNDVHDRILTETKADYHAWTGTVVIYEAPDKPFKDKVVFAWDNNAVQHQLMFNVPQQFIGKTNCVLVVEHPDFDLVSLGDNNFQLKAAEGRVSLLEHFPKQAGKWHNYDKKFRIPVDSQEQRDDSTRYLWRPGAGHVDLVARSCGYDVYGDSRRRYVVFDVKPQGTYGVAVF
jgi:hypothetical protein